MCDPLDTYDIASALYIVFGPVHRRGELPAYPECPPEAVVFLDAERPRRPERLAAPAWTYVRDMELANACGVRLAVGLRCYKDMDCAPFLAL